MTLTVVGAERHRAVLAGLPDTYRMVEGPRADVVAVAGDGWVQAAREAIAHGARAVHVSDPAGADPDAVRALQDAGAVVAVESPLLDPTWAAVAPRLRDAAGEAAVLDSVAAGRPDGLLDQLALVRDVTGGFEPAARIRTAGAHALAGTAGALAVSLTGTRTGRPELRIDLRAHTAHWSIRFDRSVLARPTIAARFGRDGGELVPTSYETLHRATWRRLAEALHDGRGLAFGLADLAAVLTLAGAGGGPSRYYCAPRP